ncbi:hypothetical protein KP509_20G049000 [Ceratopteris richardii]|uniref:Uncharacterized protein n=1 Tax=Ceratopteris richardii TaxID=49495 RepID=A0A8T2SF42_CERRI|nr:hypothetical protein KP509_20G049000 [Ceratopteris richardii]
MASIIRECAIALDARERNREGERDTDAILDENALKVWKLIEKGVDAEIARINRIIDMISKAQTESTGRETEAALDALRRREQILLKGCIRIAPILFPAHFNNAGIFTVFVDWIFKQLKIMISDLDKSPPRVRDIVSFAENSESLKRKEEILIEGLVCTVADFKDRTWSTISSNTGMLEQASPGSESTRDN